MLEQLKNSKGENLCLLIKVDTNSIRPYTKACTWKNALSSLDSFTTEVDDENFFAQLINKEINEEFHRAVASMRCNKKGWGADYFSYITINPLYGDY